MPIHFGIYQRRADNFSRTAYMHVATLHVVHGKGVRGQVSLRKTFKMVRFSVYFDQMFLKIISKSVISFKN